MVRYYDVIFSENAPSISSLLVEVEKISGIPVFFEPIQSIIYSDKIRCVSSVIEYDHMYRVFEYSNKINYLSGVILFALTNLGGNFDGKLPFWVKKPWDEVKMFFLFFTKKVIY